MKESRVKLPPRCRVCDAWFDPRLLPFRGRKLPCGHDVGELIEEED
jgi:hypothetical protein